MKRPQAGFTLTELMVVVVILGILSTMVVVFMKPRVRPIDVASRFGDMVHEASRRAIALGPVRDDVVRALGSKARTRITATQAGAAVTFTLDRLEEAGPDAANWIEIETFTTHRNVLPDSWAPKVGSYAALSPTNPAWAGFTVFCRPDGICDARTLFFQAANAGPASEQFARVSIMPLGGAITTRADWN